MTERDNEWKLNRLGDSIRSVGIVLPCEDLHATLAFFRERLGFRLDRISPADDPSEAELSRHGTRILLRRGDEIAPAVLRLVCTAGRPGLKVGDTLVAPNGTRVEIASDALDLVVPPGRQDFCHSSFEDEAPWIVGRAGMLYRDLIPGRLGGRFVASHIKITEGGRVPDSVHFHSVRFQLIFCVAGWVRVVYQDQGPPFVLEPGDAILQPPGIRHQVLESSPGLEVVEVSCPAEHDTHFDHELELPNETLDDGQRYGGQGFVRHRAASGSWSSGGLTGLASQATAIDAATDGLAQVRVLRADGSCDGATEFSHEGELLFLYLLSGGAHLDSDSRDPTRLGVGDAVTLPAGEVFRLEEKQDDLRLLEVRL